MVESNQASNHILVVNPGSTSTKVALFRGSEKNASENIEHTSEDLSTFTRIWDQREFRLQSMQHFLDTHIEGRTIGGVAGRGGLLRPVEGGVYAVNDLMLQDAESGYQGHHASNLGCVLAYDLAERFGGQSFIVDPVSTNEMPQIARISGHPAIERRSLSHALNIHYVAMLSARDLGRPPDEVRIIVAHLGGGISIAPVRDGRIIDVNDANNEGPFSTTRSGSLPPLTLSRWVIDSGFTRDEVEYQLLKSAGLQGYLGTYKGPEILRRIQENDERASLILRAMAYQVAKEIGAMGTVLDGKVDQVVLTGGLANMESLVNLIIEKVNWIAPVRVLPGEFEMEALAHGVQRVVAGAIKPKIYKETRP